MDAQLAIEVEHFAATFYCDGTNDRCLPRHAEALPARRFEGSAKRLTASCSELADNREAIGTHEGERFRCSFSGIGTGRPIVDSFADCDRSPRPERLGVPMLLFSPDGLKDTAETIDCR